MEHWAQKCDGAGCLKEYIAVCRERDELKRKLKQAEAERDAAVEDLGKLLDNCKVCRHEPAAPEDCDCECLDCKKSAHAGIAGTAANLNGAERLGCNEQYF